jgi:hypothetical protein
MMPNLSINYYAFRFCGNQRLSKEINLKKLASTAPHYPKSRSIKKETTSFFEKCSAGAVLDVQTSFFWHGFFWNRSPVDPSFLMDLDLGRAWCRAKPGHRFRLFFKGFGFVF